MKKAIRVRSISVLAMVALVHSLCVAATSEMSVKRLRELAKGGYVLTPYLKEHGPKNTKKAVLTLLFESPSLTDKQRSAIITAVANCWSVDDAVTLFADYIVTPSAVRYEDTQSWTLFLIRNLASEKGPLTPRVQARAVFSANQLVLSKPTWLILSESVRIMCELGSSEDVSNLEFYLKSGYLQFKDVRHKEKYMSSVATARKRLSEEAK